MSETKTTDFYIAGDYAGLSAGDLEFYYGYEFGKTEDGEELWGFRAKKNGKVILEIPSEDVPDRFEVVERLLDGMAKYLLQEQGK